MPFKLVFASVLSPSSAISSDVSLLDSRKEIFSKLVFSISKVLPWKCSYHDKTCLAIFKTWNLESGIWNLESGIWNLESGIWNLESGIWNLESGIWNLESGIWNLDRLSLKHRM